MGIRRFFFNTLKLPTCAGLLILFEILRSHTHMKDGLQKYITQKLYFHASGWTCVLKKNGEHCVTFVRVTMGAERLTLPNDCKPIRPSWSKQALRSPQCPRMVLQHQAPRARVVRMGWWMVGWMGACTMIKIHYFFFKFINNDFAE